MNGRRTIGEDGLVFGLVVIVALVAAVVVGTVLGHRYRVGPPVLLILSGSLLGLIPRFGDVQIDGEVVLLLFLPRELQAAMDLEEVQLLDPADAE